VGREMTSGDVSTKFWELQNAPALWSSYGISPAKIAPSGDLRLEKKGRRSDIEPRVHRTCVQLVMADDSIAFTGARRAHVVPPRRPSRLRRSTAHAPFAVFAVSASRFDAALLSGHSHVPIVVTRSMSHDCLVMSRYQRTRKN
jgi:hypothetical protein